ncbi:MAG TPA: hypothetical protein VFV94_06895 [Polyangiaceae bacterium]|nr:hypothetical protein [Polyangiaceae bacterium]
MSRRPASRATPRAALVLSLLAASFARRVSAAEPGLTHQVEVYVAPCGEPPYDPARFVELLRVELAALHVGALATNTSAPAEAQLGEGVIGLTLPVCERAARSIDLSVVERGSSTRLERRIDLSDTAFDARARMLAIAAAELYRAALAEAAARLPDAQAKPQSVQPAAAPTAAPAPAVTTSSPPLPAQPPGAHDVNPSESWALELGFAGRAYPSERSALIGGELGARVPLSRWLAVRGSAVLAFGSATLPFDDANPITSNVALGMAQGRFDLLARSRGALVLELGPRVDVGYGWVERRRGEPAYLIASSIADLGLVAAVRGPLAPRWLGFFSLYVGHALGGVALEAAQGTPGATSVGLAGMLLEATIGVGFEPSRQQSPGGHAHLVCGSALHAPVRSAQFTSVRGPGRR